MTRRRLAVVLFGIGLVPLIYAGALTWASQDPIHHLDSIPAAIVNEDRAATSAGSAPTTVNLGAELVEKLVSDDKSTDFNWVEESAEAAAAQLASGDTLVVLTIPKDFSADAVSVSGDDPTAAQLTISTNDGANQIVGNIASTVGAQVTSALSDAVSSEYLDNVYLGISDIHDQVSKAAAGARDLATGIRSAHAGSAQLKVGLGQVASGSAQVSSGASALQAGASQSSAAAVQLAAGASALSSASVTALAGAQSIDGTASQVDAGAAGVAGSSAGLASGLEALQASYATMSDADRLAAIDQLVADAQATQNAADGLKSGTGALTGYTSALVGSTAAGTGLATLSASAAALGGGAGSLATGLGSLRSGAVSLAAGASTLNNGAAGAAAGASTLDTGLQQLDSGATQLADRLETGAASIPSYSRSAATKLSEVAADPIILSTVRENEVPSTGYSLAPYFITLALWVGGLSFYLMFPALRLFGRRRPAWLTALRSYLPGAGMALAQSLLVVLIVRFGIGIDAANLPALFAIAMLTGLTFNAINQALIALIGPIGRFVALLLIVFQLASAGATYPIQTAPGVFQSIHAFLPFTYSVEAFRSLIAGGAIGVGPALYVLGAWLLGALAVTTFAASRGEREKVVLAGSVPAAL